MHTIFFFFFKSIWVLFWYRLCLIILFSRNYPSSLVCFVLYNGLFLHVLVPSDFCWHAHHNTLLDRLQQLQQGQVLLIALHSAYNNINHITRIPTAVRAGPIHCPTICIRCTMSFARKPASWLSGKEHVDNL